MSYDIQTHMLCITYQYAYTLQEVHKHLSIEVSVTCKTPHI
jgi:hypothetical protein